MRRPFALLGLALAALFWLVQVHAADDPKPRISGLAVTFDGSHVVVAFGLRHAFDARMRERIEAGLATTVLYEMQLIRDRPWWFDRKVDVSRLEVTAKYDALTMEYRVNFKLNDKLIDSRIFQDLDPLERAMTRVLDLPAFEFRLEADSREITLRVRADLGSRTWLSLVPTRITTAWAESRRLAPKQPAP